MVLLHSEGHIAAIRGVVSAGAGRYGPLPAGCPVNSDGHALRRFIDADDHVSRGGKHRNQECYCSEDQKLQDMPEEHLRMYTELRTGAIRSAYPAFPSAA